MKLYIGIEKKPQKWLEDEEVYKVHGTTMAYYDRKRLERVIGIHSAVEYEIVEIEIND